MVALFDSGVGGLSVFKELVKIAPDEDYIYYSDNANCPYGEKPVVEIRERALHISGLLIGKGADIVVVACNTATAAAIDFLREKFAIPFIGMEPAIKPAALESESKIIGVLATAGTFKGELYKNTSVKYAKGVTVIERVGKGLVELVENGRTGYDEAAASVKECVDPMTEMGADRIVLGCTHYPFLEEVIKKCAPNAKIINPAPAVAKHTLEVLQDGRRYNNTEKRKTGSLTLISSGDNSVLIRMAKAIWGGPVCIESDIQ